MDGIYFITNFPTDPVNSTTLSDSERSKVIRKGHALPQGTCAK